MDRVFVDSNVLFSAAYAPTSPCLGPWELPDTVLITSSYAIDEARRNLARYGPHRLDRLANLTVHFEIIGEVELWALAHVPDTMPNKDRPILAGAIHARATHLVTGDHAHFGPLYGRAIGGVLVQSPSEYLATREVGGT